MPSQLRLVECISLVCLERCLIQLLPHDEDHKAASEQDETDKVHASELLAFAAVLVQEMEVGWMVEEEENRDG